MTRLNEINDSKYNLQIETLFEKEITRIQLKLIKSIIMKTSPVLQYELV